MTYSPLDLVEAYLSRFVAYPSEHALVAHTLWIAHTHLMGCWESTPRIAFNSPERGSGKTRALEVTEVLVPNPIHAVNVTPAYLFRKVGDEEAGLPTILYDEVDTLFGSRVQDTGEVRGLLNAGHRRGAVAGRCIVVGKRVMTEEIPAYCAVALAGLGNLPDTIASRSVLIDMRRRAPNEEVEPFRHRYHTDQATPIKDALAGWCAEQEVSLRVAEPEMPQGIVDRDADCWEPLIAIADAAGLDWPRRARIAAIALVARSSERTQTSGVKLLADLFEVFEGADKLSTEIILHRLHRLPESSWVDIYGKALNDRGLASRLRKYGIKPRVVRIGDSTPRGYLAADLHDAWNRYVPAFRRGAQQAQQRNTQRIPTEGATESSAENCEKNGSCFGVADVVDFRGTEAAASDTAAAVDGDAFASLKGHEPRLKPRVLSNAELWAELDNIPPGLDRRKSRSVAA